MRTGKERIPTPPEWVWQVQLAQRFGVLPSAIDNEPLEWVARLSEIAYQEGMQKTRIA